MGVTVAKKFSRARLTKLRGEAGISQQELARRTGLSVHTVNFIETGRTVVPSSGTVAKLAHALSKPIDALFSDDDEDDHRGRSFGHLRLVGAAS